MLGRLADRPWGGEGRFADLEMDPVAPLRLDLAREGLDLHHLERLDVSHAGGEVDAAGVVHFGKIIAGAHPRISAVALKKPAAAFAIPGRRATRAAPRSTIGNPRASHRAAPRRGRP